MPFCGMRGVQRTESVRCSRCSAATSAENTVNALVQCPKKLRSKNRTQAPATSACGIHRFAFTLACLYLLHSCVLLGSADEEYNDCCSGVSNGRPPRPFSPWLRVDSRCLKDGPRRAPFYLVLRALRFVEAMILLGATRRVQKGFALSLLAGVVCSVCRSGHVCLTGVREVSNYQLCGNLERSGSFIKRRTGHPPWTGGCSAKLQRKPNWVSREEVFRNLSFSGERSREQLVCRAVVLPPQLTRRLVNGSAMRK